MDRADRLAAFLAGTLDADERASLEAELARDAGLRGELGAMRRADEVLAELPVPEPLPGFEDRLDAALADELRDRLGVTDDEAATADGAATAGETATARGAATDGATSARRGDELAARRRSRSLPRWIPALSGAAATVLLVVAVVSVVGPSGGDDAATSGDLEASLDRAETFDTDSSADDEAAADAGMAAPDVPVVVVGDQDLGAATDDELLAVPELGSLSARALDGEAAARLAADWQTALLVDPAAVGGAAMSTMEAPADEEAADADDAGEPVDDADQDVGDDAEETERPASEPSTALEDVGDLDALVAERAARGLLPEVREQDAPFGPTDERDVARCIAAVLPPDGSAIPAYVELGAVDGRPAMAIGLVTRDPATERATRTEMWVVTRDDCQTLRFVQGG